MCSSLGHLLTRCVWYSASQPSVDPPDNPTLHSTSATREAVSDLVSDEEYEATIATRALEKVLLILAGCSAR